MQFSPTTPSMRPFLSRLASHQRLLIGAAIVVLLGGVAWYQFHPEILFVNKTVNEGFLTASAVAPVPVDPSAKPRAGGMIHEVATGQGDKTMETATLAGGCFWCVQPPFEKLPGVSQVLAGYAGGTGADPTYSNYAEKGYVEAVQIKYDPSQISYTDLLNVFWRQINPTDAGGQFVDRGPQYRSVIFYQNDEQKREAEKSKAELAASGRFSQPIVTEIIPATTFTEAEEYHQDYHSKNPVRYSYYRWRSGRDQFLDKTWGAERTARIASARRLQPRRIPDVQQGRTPKKTDAAAV